MKTPLSLKQSFDQKNLLLVGATGFLGKVWLLMLLEKFPNTKKVYVLLRKKGSQTATQRFEKMINQSHLFAHLHAESGENFHNLLREKVVVLEGDSTQKDLGLTGETKKVLQKNLDLVVNCAGLVDFHPDLRDALSTNIYGTLECAQFVSNCDHASLLHISTCYTAGMKEGRLPEEILTHQCPSGQYLDPEIELKWIEATVEREQNKILQWDQQQILDQFPEDQQHRRKNLEQSSSLRARKTLELYRKKLLRDHMIQIGRERAKSFSWTNTYTYTKSLAEKLLVLRYPNLRFSVFRPSIIESSFSYPFAGWNEGFNTSGPLAYLLSKWFRHLPAQKGHPFDVIPVDFVCQGMMIASASLLSECNHQVYQCGSSDKNRFTIDRACELTSLSHRRYYETQGKNDTEKKYLSRFETVPVEKSSAFSMNNIYDKIQLTKAPLQWVEKISPEFLKAKIKPVKHAHERLLHKLNQTKKVVNLFTPFTHDFYQIFETHNLMSFDLKEKDMAFSPEKISWRQYWIDIQMPALRKWCFPLIEGKEKPVYHPEILFVFDQKEKSSSVRRGIIDQNSVAQQSAAR